MLVPEFVVAVSNFSWWLGSIWLHRMMLIFCCSLADRLNSHAQYRKAEALSILADAVISTELKSDTLEAPHRILSLLYNVSDSPLNADFAPCEAAQKLLQELSGKAFRLFALVGASECLVKMLSVS